MQLRDVATEACDVEQIIIIVRRRRRPHGVLIAVVVPAKYHSRTAQAVGIVGVEAWLAHLDIAVVLEAYSREFIDRECVARSARGIGTHPERLISHAIDRDPVGRLAVRPTRNLRGAEEQHGPWLDALLVRGICGV